MRRYTVVFSDEAAGEFAASVQWGYENWGEEETWHWYAKIRSSIRDTLSIFPLSHPIAPDSEEYEIEVRQMVIGRYRILYTFDGKRVTILHLTGPYAR
jgi:plasmid stabilization system protein ParE